MAQKWLIWQLVLQKSVYTASTLVAFGTRKHVGTNYGNESIMMCSHFTHLIRGISNSRKLLNRKKRCIENMIFQLFWRFRSWIKIYIMWNHAFYVYLLGKEFQASYHGHRFDMILIAKTNFMRSYWPKQCSS